MNLKDKKLPVIIAGAVVVVILLILIFMPGKGPDEQGPEVISKRVKIEMTDTSADISASIEPTTAGEPTPATAPVAAPAPVAPAPVMEAKPAPVEPKAAVRVVPPAPAPTVKAEAPKTVKTVKPVKKAVEKPKKTAVAKKKIAPAGTLALNIASFTSLSEAQNLAGKLKKGGYNAYIASFTKDSVRWHRVRVGFFASRDEATKAGKAIQSKFRVDKPWIAKPDATELKTHL